MGRTRPGGGGSDGSTGDGATSDRNGGGDDGTDGSRRSTVTGSHGSVVQSQESIAAGLAQGEPGSGAGVTTPATRRTTVNQDQAPTQYTPADVEAAYNRAPVDDQGRRVDHRTGEPLYEPGGDGRRAWHMKWDPDKQEWVAENPGSGSADSGDLPRTGEPNSYGYDDQGNRMPYANNRPNYAEGQVEAVWDEADTDGDGFVWVEGPDGDPVLVAWQPGEPREGVWDMGHLPNEKYSVLRDDYLNHRITREEFLARYQNPDNYQVENPTVNRSHRNE